MVYGTYDNPGRSCLHLSEMGVKKSGYYVIKPSQNISAFEVSKSYNISHINAHSHRKIWVVNIAPLFLFCFMAA